MAVWLLELFFFFLFGLNVVDMHVSFESNFRNSHKCVPRAAGFLYQYSGLERGVYCAIDWYLFLIFSICLNYYSINLSERKKIYVSLQGKAYYSTPAENLVTCNKKYKVARGQPTVLMIIQPFFISRENNKRPCTIKKQKLVSIIGQT